MSRSLSEPDRAPARIAPDALRRVCAQFATGVAVATVIGQDGRPWGLTINSLTSVSCSPPLILICIDYRCSLLAHFRASSWFGVNILSAAQKNISARFADFDGDRFESVDWTRGHVTGVPLLTGAIGKMECSVSQVVEAGDHAVLFAEVAAAECCPGDPLLYYGSGYRSIQPCKKEQ